MQKIQKCEFFKNLIVFFGHLISAHGIEVCEKKIKAVKNFSLSTCVKDVRSFLELTNFYRKFIKDCCTFDKIITQKQRIHLE